MYFMGTLCVIRIRNTYQQYQLETKLLNQHPRSMSSLEKVKFVELSIFLVHQKALFLGLEHVTSRPHRRSRSHRSGNHSRT